ncbi:hypothetical protein [Streptomyces canus]|uniref:hypothetical protein n=1 Tax=Streptomyces canus TaxID=58343 RepID=UPI000376D4E5
MLSRFRVEFYEYVYARADTLFELSSAVEHRRGHGALCAAWDRGWAEPARLRRAPAVDVSNWRRPDGPTSDEAVLVAALETGRKTCQ